MREVDRNHVSSLRVLTKDMSCCRRCHESEDNTVQAISFCIMRKVDNTKLDPIAEKQLVLGSYSHMALIDGYFLSLHDDVLYGQVLRLHEFTIHDSMHITFPN